MYDLLSGWCKDLFFPKPPYCIVLNSDLDGCLSGYKWDISAEHKQAQKMSAGDYYVRENEDQINADRGVAQSKKQTKCLFAVKLLSQDRSCVQFSTTLLITNSAKTLGEMGMLVQA